ncbi:hypothetical protein GE061_006095 [Apolygus lucorum]|uniref:Homeobox domain-containing protein n=1 Tax=Apolygus lucorum TaxID=248454 RepID=A0A8S9WSZ7_APOLU|nr:hypothetical protein GE061_006095 [Apolygus lucorum]
MMQSEIVCYSGESHSVRYSDDFFSKASIYWHPLFPLLARTFENCHNATNGALNHLKPVAETFKYDAQIFADHILKSNPCHYPNKEVDSLVVSCISELRSHLLILEQIDHLTDTFHKNCVTNIKRNLSSENIFGREDPFSYTDSSSEDDDDWFDEILDQGGRAKRQKLDTDWIRKYSNIIPDFMSCNVKNPISRPVGCSKSITNGMAAAPKDSLVEYRASTQIFQSPKVGGSSTCTAFRSVEYVVWEKEMQKSSVPAKPVSVRPQGLVEYKKPTSGLQELKRPEPKPLTHCQHNPCSTTQMMNPNENIESRSCNSLVQSQGIDEFQKARPVPKLLTQHHPHPIPPVQTANPKEITETRSDSLVAHVGTISNVNKCDGFTQTSGNMGRNLLDETSSSNYSNTLPTRDSENNDATQHTSSFSTLPFGDSQSFMSTTDLRTSDLANLSTTSNGNSTVDCTYGARSGEIGEQVRKPSVPSSFSTDGKQSDVISISDSVASRTRSAIAADSIASNVESEPNNKTDSTRTSEIASSGFSNKTVVVGRCQEENTNNTTFASHYQQDTTLDGGISSTGEGRRNDGGTFIVNDVDFSVEFAEGQTFELESAKGSALGATFTDSDAESFSRECEALIATLKKATRPNRDAWDDSRNSKNNLHLLRPFSTPLVGQCPAMETPSDPAEKKFVQDLKSWDPSTEGRGKRIRKTPIWNDSSQGPPGRGIKYTVETSAILKSWFDDHINRPYPTQDEITSLVMATGLSRVQIRAWFTYRRRMARKSGSLSSLETEL